MGDYQRSNRSYNGFANRTPALKDPARNLQTPNAHAYDLGLLHHVPVPSKPTTPYRKPIRQQIPSTEQLSGEVKTSKKRKAEADIEEKRVRRFRPKPPQSFSETYNRALTQRFFVISRKRCGTIDCPEEVVELTGSTGNIYTVQVATQPTCSCPHAEKGHQCKHILYVMSRVLHAKLEYVYQLALVSSELRDIFARAPPIESDAVVSKLKNRKAVEGDCPICFCEFEADSKESIVWCRAACGQNIHKECFEMWAATKRQGHGKTDVTCPFCRGVWQGDDDMIKRIKKSVAINHEGYVNVADQLGISTWRDTSTYSRWWRG